MRRLTLLKVRFSPSAVAAGFPLVHHIAAGNQDVELEHVAVGHQPLVLALFDEAQSAKVVQHLAFRTRGRRRFPTILHRPDLVLRQGVTLDRR
jgi:hypothetical protein